MNVTLKIMAILCLAAPFLKAQDQVRFQDIATQVESGVDFQRTPSLRVEPWRTLLSKESLTNQDYATIPMHGRGIPGVVLFDYDNDGDVDIYVSNGPETPNSLYANQWAETGQVTFIDKAIEAGVTATTYDGAGVVAGDIDNDGDKDLYVLNVAQDNRLFENNGDGTFSDITEASGAGAAASWSISASMGDVNGDGLLDIFIGNFGNINSHHIIFVDPFAFNEHNQLLINQGNNQFVDMAFEAGLHDLAGLPEEFEGYPGPTWTVALVDYDLDGDLDVFSGDDQAGFPNSLVGGFNRGLLHLFENDGTGNFENVSAAKGLTNASPWMGLSFGDYNSDGYMDFFASNFGNYHDVNISPFIDIQINSSRWYLGSDTGRFSIPPMNNVGSSVFGWGTVTADYDNDGDSDIIYHGGLDMHNQLQMANPGVMLRNNGEAIFDYDGEALAESTDHLRRNVIGVSSADLNNDGFVDIVSTSSYDVREDLELETWPDRGSQLDGVPSRLVLTMPGNNPGEERYNPELFPYDDLGSMSIEINNGNTLGSAQFRLLGAKGLSPHGRVNRDGIGAVVTFTPDGGQPAMVPIIAGASFASQSDLAAHMGMGDSVSGVVDVLWPGGGKTRLYDVLPGEDLVLPELPVSYDNDSLSFFEYYLPIKQTLNDLVQADTISTAHADRVRHSAIKAWLDHKLN